MYCLISSAIPPQHLRFAVGVGLHAAKAFVAVEVEQRKHLLLELTLDDGKQKRICGFKTFDTNYLEVLICYYFCNLCITSNRYKHM
ncbi:MAG: hypothetical protein WBM44_00750 [Waterburya sp.]